VSDDATLTLNELADTFDLTPRTARHYIEKVLPPRHRQGRGKRARYGRATRNCFAFIIRARREGLTMTQIAELLRSLNQAGIDRVAAGLDGFSVVIRAAGQAEQPHATSRQAKAPGEAPDASRPGQARPHWQILYADDELQITHRGRANPEQRSQVRMAAAYIRRVFEQADEER
jgi:DNA-binding transcriptional MerR regulator